ncbi:MAG: HAMP domain-containing histidine kinase [Pseudomonadales bacterium]|nr:HAMP domain-containing histidine kinase [Pseudomonadales bacterium]NRA15789.1 HAMP domain-containing histidine kinase [Oceanospirillaceae bacterium]
MLQFIKRLKSPRSLNQRIIFMMAVGVVLAQLISNTIWTAQWRSDYETRVADMSFAMANRVTSTVRFFVSLPNAYRHLVLDQLRDMGGTRFFVTLNKEKIQLADVVDSPAKTIVIDAFNKALRQELGEDTPISTVFSLPSDLRVINNHTMLSDLPERWGHQTLMLAPYNAPILVVQFPINKSEWLYVATIIPSLLLEDSISPLSKERVISLLVSLLTVLLIGITGVRYITRPIRRLGQAAERVGRGESVIVPVRGSSEEQLTAQAFNDMQQRIQRYLDDRERLFASISHDLKTPITRLRLRTELLEDDSSREAFSRDLEDLDLMVKGALQSVSDTDIHENQTAVDISRLLQHFAEDAKIAGQSLQLLGDNVSSFSGKPLALKRCIGNLLDNALHYGSTVTVKLTLGEQHLSIEICDDGPGIPEQQISQVFQPYIRVAPSLGHIGGMGLGLSIARNIARAHGGDIELCNLQPKGLKVSLVLPVQGSDW